MANVQKAGASTAKHFGVLYRNSTVIIAVQSSTLSWLSLSYKVYAMRTLHEFLKTWNFSDMQANGKFLIKEKNKRSV